MVVLVESALHTMTNPQFPDSESEEVAKLVQRLYEIVDRLEEMFGRRFTLDGHLVGSLGEAMARAQYGIKLLPASTERHDAVDPATGRSVQIKATQRERVGLRSEPEHLLVLRLNRDGSVEEIYNGPGHEPWNAAGRMQKNGQRPISVTKLSRLMMDVPMDKRLRRKRGG